MKRIITLCSIIILLVCVAVASAEQPTDKPVRMAYLQNDIHHLALWIALENGLFEKQGVKVEVSGIFRAGPEIMTAFAAKELDMAYVGEAPTTTAVANKATDVVIVAQVNTEGSALVVAKKGSGITGLPELKGKTIAVPGHSTVQDFLLRRALKKQGINLKDVNIIVVKPPEMISALRTDQINAFIAWEPYPSKAITMETGRNLATSHDIWKGHPCCVLVSDSAFFKKNRDKVSAVVRAHVQATDYIRKNQDQAVRIGVKYTGMDEKTVRQAMKTVHFTYDLSIEGEKEYVEFLTELKYIRVDDPDTFVNSLINQELLKKILQ
ncbi:MAG: ABC transporter substrate-binding protein [Desulfobacterales bacterium]|nr:ABC transporter substrate-binding protein [Desulfobacterales bacterium]